MEWCEQNGEKEVTQKTFGRCLAERGLTKAKSGSVRYWKGIGLVTSEDAGTHRDTWDARDTFSSKFSRERDIGESYGKKSPDTSLLVQHTEITGKESVPKASQSGTHGTHQRTEKGVPEHLLGKITPELAEEVYGDK